jgi:hypothetical protein
LTIRAAAGTAAAASVAAAVIAAGPALFTPAADGGEPGSPGTTGDLALATGRMTDALAARHVAATAAPAEPENPALAVRQAMNERYAQAVRASKRAAVARQAAERRRALSGSPQQIAMAMLASFGWSASQFSCLSALWDRESGWNPYAANPSSGAYGIPQALPGSKMAAAGPDWQTDAATQIRWGLGYIKASYGSPCGALGHEESSGWY